MNEVGLVFMAEFLRKVRSRVFVAATIAGAVMVAFLIEAPLLFTHVSLSSTKDVIVAGPSPLRETVAHLLADGPDFTVIATVPSLPHPVTLAYLKAHGDAAAAIAVSSNGKRLHLDIYPRDLAAYSDVAFRDLVPLNAELATGVPRAELKPALKIDRTLHPVDAKFADSSSATFAHGVAFGLMFILYFAIIIASQNVMSAVAEEKTSRIAEILVSTISPVNLLTGKTLAAAALAIAQIGVWVATAVVLLPQAGAALGGASPAVATKNALPLVDPGVIVAFALFFVLGYLQYATIYAASASLISRTEDLGTVTTPVILPVVGAFFVAQYALLQPDAPFAVAFSFVPFFSPFVMFTRIAVSAVPWWQIALSVAINLVTVAACFYAAGKVYRIGMLLYGKLPAPKQILAAIRA
jgi:ABC-2 type transport system permease protein